MLNTMMIAGALSESFARRFGRSLFRLAFGGFATIAPQTLLAYATAATGDSALRAQMVVAGSERIVLALVAVLVARAIYTLFTQSGAAPADAGILADAPAVLA
jgi:hypothetical protein